MSSTQRTINVEYEILVSVVVDADTGEVIEVNAHTGEFNHGVKPLQFFGDTGGGYQEEIEADHPEAVKALAAVDLIEAKADVISVPFDLTAAAQAALVTVEIENDYSDGHQSKRTLRFDAPGDDDIEAWFNEVVYPETGDGHGGDACYTARIVRAADEQLVGKEYEWIG